MNFKNILKISAILIGIGVISTPLIYQKQINKALNIATNELKHNNILVQEKQNKDTFIKLNREYILTISDSTYLIKNLYPEIDPITLQDLKSLLDNSKILVTLNFIKYPIYHKNAITLSLISLNETLTNELKSQKAGIDLLKFIQNKGLEAFIDINNFKISQAKLKDINLKIADNESFLNFILTNTHINFDRQTSAYISEFNIQTPYNKFGLSNLLYKIDYKNDFNTNTKLSISHINYQIENINFKIDNFKIKNTLFSTLNKLNLSNNLEIQNLNVQDKLSNNINIKNFKFNFKIEKIDLISLKKIIYSLDTKNYDLKDITTLLNKGFNIKINPLSVKQIQLKIDSQPIDISKIGISLNLYLKPNKLNLEDSEKFLKYMDIDLNIITTKANIELVELLMPISKLYLQNIMVEKNNNVMINLSYKNNKLLSNGKQLF